jgi:CBS domain-containing protein
MRVRDIMTSDELATATLDTTLEEIANMMKEENVGAIPILDEDDNLAGIVTDRDIVVRAIAEGQDPSSCTAEEILSEQLHTIQPDASLEDAADLMARHKIRRLPVVEDDVIIGMISLGDISVKAEEEEDKSGEALGEISEGVKETSGKTARASGNGGGRGQQQTSARGEQRQTFERGPERSENRQSQQNERQGRGATQRSGSVESQFSAAGRTSPGEDVAAEEAEYQRESASRRGGQQGGTRAENAFAGRFRDQSRSQQSMADDLVNNEGEEEPTFQNAGGGQARQRANQQRPNVRGQQGASGQRQGREGNRAEGGRQQGISNRDVTQERKGQQKVTSERAEARGSSRNRGNTKRRAS